MSADVTPLQHTLRKEVIQLVGRDWMKQLQTKRVSRYLFTVSHVWVGIVVALALVCYLFHQFPWVLIALWLPLAFYISTRMNALNVQVHEGSHYLLAKSRKANDLLCNWVAGYPILYDADQYRATHIVHHSKLNEEDDPDREFYELPETRGALVGLFLQDFFWITLLKRVVTIKTAMANRPKTSVGKSIMHLLGRAVWQCAVLGAFYLMFGLIWGVLLYGFFWLVPLFSIFPMIIRVRLITEHYDPMVFEKDGVSVFVARTSVCKPLQHYLLGAQMDYHFEHHLFPAVPYAQLHVLHKRLRELDLFESNEHVVLEHSLSGGYMAYWSRAVREHFQQQKNLSQEPV